MLLAIGVRGRQTDDHPHCRGCGFDLFGLFPRAERCPECGGGLQRSGAVRDGGRTKRSGWIAAGVVTLVMSVVSLGTAVVGSGAWPAAYGMMPDAVLVWMMETPAAREEVASRLATGEFGQASASRVISKALDAQGDRSRPWDASWGDLVELAAVGGYAQPLDLERYAHQSAGFQLNVRPKIKIGLKPGAYLSAAPDLRIGSTARVEVQLRVQSMKINGRAVQSRLPQNPAEISIKAVGPGNSSPHLPMDQFPQSLGLVTLETTVEPSYTLHLPTSATVHSFKKTPLQIDAHTQVVDHYTGNYITGGPSDKERAANAGVWFELDTRRTSGAKRLLIFGTRQPEAMHNLDMWLRIGEPSEIISVDSVRASWGSGGIMSGHNVRQAMDLTDLPERFREAKTADLIIRTDFASAETISWSGRRPVWLGEWVMKGVPLDAAEVPEWEAFGDDPPPTLIAVTARSLTPEQAARDPE